MGVSQVPSAAVPNGHRVYRCPLALNGDCFTYFLGLGLVLCRVELLRLLRVVRYRALALAEFLRLVFGLAAFLLGRHDECNEEERDAARRRAAWRCRWMSAR